MTIKEFLRLDWRKALVTILFMGYSVFVFDLNVACDPDDSGFPIDKRPFPYDLLCISIIPKFLSIPLIPTFIFLFLFAGASQFVYNYTLQPIAFDYPFVGYLYTIISVSVLVFFVYFLSCLIVFIYDKYKLSGMIK